MGELSQLSDAFQIAFNLVRIPYLQLDEVLNLSQVIHAGDKINLCINVESILKYISMIQGVDQLLAAESHPVQGLVREFINTVAHYRSFFRKNHHELRVVLYYTGLKEESFPQTKYNEFFRSYYQTKYNTNPKYALFTHMISKDVLPTVRAILEYVNQSYLISVEGAEGSVLPLIIEELDPSYKTIVITADPYDTQYRFIKQCLPLFITRTGGRKVWYQPEDFIKQLTKEDYVKVPGNPLITNRSYYTTFLSTVIGSRDRSIDNIRGVGYKTFLKLLSKGFKEKSVEMTTRSIDLIAGIFPERDRERVKQNYFCTDLVSIYKELPDAVKYQVKQQLIDKTDNNALVRLNTTYFKPVAPINVEALLL